MVPESVKIFSRVGSLLEDKTGEAKQLNMTNMECEERNGEDVQVAIPPQAVISNHEKFNNYRPGSCNSNSAEPAKVEPMLCSCCHKPIVDQYYMWVDKRSWHESCMQCDVCRKPLVDSCYSKNHKLYCLQDYKQLQKCRRCLELIPLTDFFLNVSGQPYHVNCFSCDFCHRKLQPGDHYVVDESSKQICCNICHEPADHVTSIDHEMDFGSDSDASDDELFSPHPMQIPGMRYLPNYGVPGGMHHRHMLLQGKGGSKSVLTSLTSCDGKRVKRPRTILTTAQRRKFKASFEVSPKPCRKVRETLAAETGLSPRVVQVWFQNQRAKIKKIARRQGDGSGPGKSRNGHRAGRKKTLDSDSDNELSSPGSYISMPTPHQATVYHDTYRSPASIQTSPTASVPDMNSYCQPTHNVTHDSTTDFLYDEFESSFFSVGDAFVTQTPTSSTQSATLSIVESRLHSEDLSLPPNDFSNITGSTVMAVDGDGLPDLSPQDPFQHFGSLQTLTPFPNQVQNESNPIDRLMCMQSTFFRS